MTKEYKVPTNPIARFFYNWREYNLRLAWAYLTNPKSFETIPADSNEK